jgi:hypothetical protein
LAKEDFYLYCAAKLFSVSLPRSFGAGAGIVLEELF